MSKQPLKNIVSMLIKDKDHDHILPIVINKAKSRACKLKFLLLWLMNLEYFSFTILEKKWVGRAMGNETFYWDDLKNKPLHLDIVITWKDINSIGWNSFQRNIYENRFLRFLPKVVFYLNRHFKTVAPKTSRKLLICFGLHLKCFPRDAKITQAGF